MVTVERYSFDFLFMTSFSVNHCFFIHSITRFHKKKDLKRIESRYIQKINKKSPAQSIETYRTTSLPNYPNYHQSTFDNECLIQHHYCVPYAD